MPDWIKNYWTQWLFGIIGGWIIGTVARLKSKMKRQKAVEAGVEALLYDKLYYLHGKFMKQKWISIADFNNFERCYQAYRKLGANGTGTVMYEEVRALRKTPPTEKAS